MKRCFSLLLLSSMGVCLAAGQNEDLQTKVAAMARILSEVYDESKGCIKQPDTVQTKRNLYELQQLARDLKIGIRDKSSHGSSRLCSLCTISLLHDPRFQALPKPSKEDKKEELVCYVTCGGVCFCDKDGAAKTSAFLFE